MISNAANNYVRLVSLLTSVFQVFKSVFFMQPLFYLTNIVCHCHYSSAAALLGEVYKLKSRQKVTVGVKLQSSM